MLRGSVFFPGDLCYERSIYDDVRLKTHGVEKYPHPVRIRHPAFKSTAEILEPAVIDFYFITGLEVVVGFDKAITSDLRSHQFDDLVINRSGLVVEAHHTMHPSGVTHFVEQLVIWEATEDVSREQRLHEMRQLTTEFVELVYS